MEYSKEYPGLSINKPFMTQRYSNMKPPFLMLKTNNITLNRSQIVPNIAQKDNMIILAGSIMSAKCDVNSK
uniref:Uncharacterized protein n=1 Tax=Romanomermis culicivorax TaxID=13658 RepID=A0A915J6D9_ROMCU